MATAPILTLTKSKAIEFINFVSESTNYDISSEGECVYSKKRLLSLSIVTNTTPKNQFMFVSKLALAIRNVLPCIFLGIAGVFTITQWAVCPPVVTRSKMRLIHSI